MPTAEQIEAYISNLFGMRFQAALVSSALSGSLDRATMHALAEDLAHTMMLEALEGWQGMYIPLVRVRPMESEQPGVFTMMTSVSMVPRYGLTMN